MQIETETTEVTETEAPSETKPAAKKPAAKPKVKSNPNPKKKRSTMAKKNATERVSAEEFVQTWQKCKSLDEARERLGDGASARASRYRKLGVSKLQKFVGTRGPALDAKALNKLIA